MDDYKKIIREFNIRGYTDESVKYQTNGKGGLVLTLKEGAFTYEDEFYGGEPYSGNETIWKNDICAFRCVYWGKVYPKVKFSDIYVFLRKALRVGPDSQTVHRGPRSFSEGNLRYENISEGTINEFRMREEIYLDDSLVYVAYFYGGLTNTHQ